MSGSARVLALDPVSSCVGVMIRTDGTQVAEVQILLFLLAV